ncbi:MAG: long-chain fatty acid--CoA ligase [Alphaproteobacteria bacterium]|nr:long-chain fatty acid--CoA ligase [Alphaproteobacteria bacterium]
MSNAVDTAQFRNLAQMFFTVAGRMGDRPFAWAKKAGQWQSTSWAAAAADARALALALRAMGVRAGDRVFLVAENRPEWPVADVAIMAAGAITVPAYITNTAADHRHILTDSGARLAIVSTPRLLEPVLAAAADAPALEAVIMIEPGAAAPAAGRPRILAWTEALARGKGGDPAGLAQRARTDTACLIYTSGTGGAPKGVMLSHGAILHNCRGARLLLETLGLEDETFLSFLPLSHSYEHTAGLHFPISIAAQIYYAEGADKLAANLPETRPTIMTAVPRLYEMMHQRIVAGVERTGGLKAKLFHRALALGRKKYTDPRSLSLVERLTDAVLDRLVRDKVRARFGGRLKVMVSGGAPLNAEIGLFFTALGVRILQGYGLTECAPLSNCNPPPRVKIHTVGPAVADVEVQIAADGEILIRGENVMQGYWGLPDLTAQTVRDGWLHTGDIGVLDADNYLQITDRKKDIIVNSGGDNVAPQRVEGFLTLRPEIAQAMVHGDRRPYLVAVVVPRQEFLEAFAKAHGRPPNLAALADDADLHKALGTALDQVNAGLSVIERVRRFVVASEPFTIANGMMTPSMKVRRHVVKQAYGEKLEGLY